MIKVRLHCGGLAESMSSAKELNTVDECLQFFRSGTLVNGPITSKWYDDTDDRIGWAPVYVVRDSSGVVGFSDGPVQDSE